MNFMLFFCIIKLFSFSFVPFSLKRGDASECAFMNLQAKVRKLKKKL